MAETSQDQKMRDLWAALMALADENGKMRQKVALRRCKMADDKDKQIRNLAAKVKTLLNTVRQKEEMIEAWFAASPQTEPTPTTFQVLTFAKLVNTKVDILGGVYRTETRPDIACWLDAERLMKEILRDIAVLEGGVK